MILIIGLSLGTYNNCLLLVAYNNCLFLGKCNNWSLFLKGTPMNTVEQRLYVIEPGKPRNRKQHQRKRSRWWLSWGRCSASSRWSRSPPRPRRRARTRGRKPDLCSKIFVSKCPTKIIFQSNNLLDCGSNRTSPVKILQRKFYATLIFKHSDWLLKNISQ